MRASLAALLAALSFALAFDLHTDHFLVESLAGAARSTYSPEAAHPAAGRHLEAATRSERPECAACLLRMQSAGARPLQALPAVTSAFRGGVAEIVKTPHPCGAGSPRRGRAPPLA
jgi:hypothetical protein